MTNEQDRALCERCAVLEDLLETATSERDKARDESAKADDEVLALKVRDIVRLTESLTGSYAAIKRFEKRALEAEGLADRLAEAARGVADYLNTMLVDDDPDDETVGWEAVENGEHSKPIDFTMGQIRRVNEALAAHTAARAR